MAQFAVSDFPRGAPLVVRLLRAARWKVGALFGWDRPSAATAVVRERLPEDLRAAPSGPELGPFTPLYLLEDESAAELGNRLLHAVMHLGWVPDGSGRYRGQMAVLVKPRGAAGSVYMAAIKPFRHLVVYPALLRTIERGCRARTNA